MTSIQLTELEQRYKRPLVFMLTGGFEHLIDKAGGQLQSFTLRGYEGDWLLVIRVTFDERWRIGFVGAVTAAGALVRAEKQLREGDVNWQVDRYNPDE